MAHNVNDDRREDARVTTKPATVSLDDLLAAITDEKRHDDVDFGKPVGEEIW